ncbi:DNA-binding protein inhibitor ID-3 [Anolis carolinensis]|uniref:DNA-binding protein inhibitor ID-3 n=1 Tax=Anolis carolinensis TaxID=28377 RepID=UPI002F2B3101
MKAMSPVRSVRGCVEAACCLSEGSLGLSRGKSPGPGPEEAAAPGLLDDMRGCYSRLAALVPGIPQGSQPSQVEILQRVIDYIFDLQLVLEEQATRSQKHNHKNKSEGRSSARGHHQNQPAAELASELCSTDERTPCH